MEVIHNIHKKKRMNGIFIKIINPMIYIEKRNHTNRPSKILQVKFCF